MLPTNIISLRQLCLLSGEEDLQRYVQDFLPHDDKVCGQPDLERWVSIWPWWPISDRQATSRRTTKTLRRTSIVLRVFSSLSVLRGTYQGAALDRRKLTTWWSSSAASPAWSSWPLPPKHKGEAGPKVKKRLLKNLLQKALYPRCRSKKSPKSPPKSRNNFFEFFLEQEK